MLRTNEVFSDELSDKNHNSDDYSLFQMPNSSEEVYARERRSLGFNIFYHEGRYWEVVTKGFLRPVNYLKPLENVLVPKEIITSYKAQKLFNFKWGLQYVVNSSDLAYSNSSIPAHVLNDVKSFSISSLSSKERAKIRRASKKAYVTQLTADNININDAYEVYVSAMERTRFSKGKSKEDFSSSFKKFISSSYRLVLGAFIDQKLSGYISAFTIDDYAYGEEVFIGSLGKSADAHRLLMFEITQAVASNNSIKLFFIGQHWRERQGITDFKIALGFPVVSVPTYTYINPIVTFGLKKFLPHKYYRLSGK
jgi:hypothetical protein